MRNLVIAFLLLISCSAFAVNKTVIGNSGQGWGIAFNWSPSGVPADGDVVIIPEGQTISVKGAFYTGTETIIIKVSGTLDFDPSGKLDLGINSEVQLLTTTAKLTSNGTGSEIIKIGSVTKFDGSVDGMMLTGPLYASQYTTSSPSGFSSSAVLPVKLLAFSATIKDGVIILSWQTTEETNTKLFSLERSTTGSTYESIGKVNAKGSGSSYQLRDALASRGLTFYRLKTVDIDGRAEYSRTISITKNCDALYSMVPNPANQNIKVLNSTIGSDKTVVQIFDVAGTKVFQKQYRADASIDIDVSAYRRGIYFIRINGQAEKIILQ